MAAPMRKIVYIIKTLNNVKCSKLLTVSINEISFPYPSYTFSCRKIYCQRLLVQCNKLSDVDMKKMMDNLKDKFADARELLADARENKGTVYFSEDLKDAQEAVKTTLEEYQKLLMKLSDQQKHDVISTLGLRMEELKAQQSAIEEEVAEHH
ncbi:uncharacterized protein LOC127868979 [Dreissena polymorpha]|uniref:Uncharacterized protein n=1 Tax=Dreissena polymorpha TaxID=45954 RepID=A0A9D4M983_DREPO|nr:uncharacterized protein LOC127868979 [Dreissena polymorpha]KAH3873262.1 hypothetical protein DPMN_036493 [Dreissena polymorpha]